MFKSGVTWPFTHYKPASVIAHARSCSLHRKRSTQHLLLWKDTGEITNCLFLWRRESGPSSKTQAILGPPQGTLCCCKWGLGFPECCYVCDFSSLCWLKWFHHTKCGQRSSSDSGVCLSEVQKAKPSINNSLYPTPSEHCKQTQYVSHTFPVRGYFFQGVVYISCYSSRTHCNTLNFLFKTGTVYSMLCHTLSHNY